MTEYLKGNYPLDTSILGANHGANCNPFEKLALSRLGGSICFVAKAPLVWPGASQGDGAQGAQ